LDDCKAVRFNFFSVFVVRHFMRAKSLASTSTFTIVNVDETHMWSRAYVPDEQNEFQHWQLSFDPRNIDTATITNEELSRYTEERFFDSVIAGYNSSNFEGMLPNKDTTETEGNKVKENFFKILKRTYGVLESKTPIKKLLLTRKSNTEEKCVVIFYAATFKSMKGRFSIMLDVTNRYRPSFVDMRCTPFDYNSIPFFSNISGLTLEYIRNKNTSELVDEASKDFQRRTLSKAKLQKSLAVINCDSLTQFTSNLILQGALTYARVVYDVRNTEKYLALVFVSEDNKFKLYDLGFIDKKKQ
jgi:hypothetical protein